MNINRVVITGNLTKDPDLHERQNGITICNLRVACNTKRRNSDGEWVDKPNYFNVTTFGALAENVARYLSKGSPLAVDGRLEWREWAAQDTTKRQSVEIIADSIQFLGNGNGASSTEGNAEAAPAGAGAKDDTQL